MRYRQTLLSLLIQRVSIVVFLLSYSPMSGFCIPANSIDHHDGRALNFVENKGQIRDQYGNPRNDIQFKVGDDALSIFISAGSIHYQFSRQRDTPSPECKDNEKARAKLYPYDMYRLDMSLMGADTHARVVLGQQLPCYEHYYTSALESDACVRSFSSILYKNIYPAIDWKIYLHEGRLEYDFIVHPGGNPADIRIQYNGATHIESATDHIKVETPLGFIKETKLFLYDSATGNNLSAGFKHEGNVFGFKVKDNGKNTYIIDPTLEWATYYGGSANDQGSTITCNRAGDVFVAGMAKSTSNIATTGSYQTVFGGYSDAFLARFSSTGAMIWATYFGGESADDAIGISCDNAGSVYVAGATNSTMNIATVGAYKTSLSNVSNNDGFIAKFTESGTRIWSTYFGSDSTDDANKIVCDGAGNVYVSGVTKSPSGIATSGSWQTVYGGGNTDCFLAKFNTSGSLLWSTYMGGEGTEQAAALALDSYGHVYIGGNTTSTTNIATAGSASTTLNGSSDGFISRFSSEGSLERSTYYGGEGQDYIQAAAAENSGLYICGTTSSTTNISLASRYQDHYGGGSTDGFIARMDTSLSLIWSTYFGDTGDDELYGLALNAHGGIGISGFTNSTDRISTPSAWQTNLLGTHNTCVAVFDETGQLHWASYYGGTGETRSVGAIADTAGSIYLTGFTNSPTNIATTGAYQSAVGGAYDTYIAKFGAFDITGVQGVTQALPLAIFPVPNDGKFSIKGTFGNDIQSVNLTVTDVTGKKIYSSTEPVSGGSLLSHVDMASAMPGVYMVQVRTVERMYVMSFVKD